MDNTTRNTLPANIISKSECSTCIMGFSMVVNGDILCRIKGAVSKNYICRKYKRSPFILNASARTMGDTCAECRFFQVDPSDNDPVRMLMNLNSPEVGLCSLFSVRKYNGRTRKACSKFISKDTLEAS
jgi:hypothetical protein